MEKILNKILEMVNDIYFMGTFYQFNDEYKFTFFINENEKEIIRGVIFDAFGKAIFEGVLNYSNIYFTKEYIDGKPKGNCLKYNGKRVYSLFYKGIWKFNDAKNEINNNIIDKFFINFNLPYSQKTSW